MLDLSFVRANLELVEEKLRARGADPAALLGDFRALDKNRREAITQSEQLKARRNELSQQVGALKKSGKTRLPTLLRRLAVGPVSSAESALPSPPPPARRADSRLAK